MAKLLGEEQEADDEFWSHETWKEEDGDDEYDSADALAGDDGAGDDADSDFDRPEEADEAVVGEDDVEREQKEEAAKKRKMKRVYHDPAKKRPKPATEEEPKEAEEKPVEAQPSTPKQQQQQQQQQQQRTLRQSTVKRTISTAERQEREKEETEERRQMRRRRKSGKKGKSATPMSQEQRMREAEATAEANKQSLFEIMQVFNEKKVLAQRKLRPIGVGITTVSREKVDPATGRHFVENTVTFPPGADLPASMTAAPMPQRQIQQQPRVCAVTGLPAKYRDPLTGLFFANAAAFRTIRERTARAAGTQVDQQIVDLSLALEDKRNRLTQILTKQQPVQH